MNRTPYEAGGFAFPDEKMMEKAMKEAEGIRYVRNRVNLKEPKAVLQVYCQMVKQKLFETPVGYAFLYELQEYLWTNPTISHDDIPAIPVVANAGSSLSQKEEKEKKTEPVKTKTKVVRKTSIQNIDYKNRFQASLSICVILLLIVIGMFAVTATSGNINIVNYENELIEKYENWETKLNEREEKLKEREKQLNAADEN